MNIALPAFLLIIAIAPGYLFLSSFNRKESTTLSPKPFDVFSAQALIYAALLHLGVLTGIYVLGYKIDYTVLLKILTGMELINSDLTLLKGQFQQLGIYHVGVSSLGYGLGKVCQFVRFKTNPYKESRYAYNLPWYYELRGKISAIKKADIIKVACTVQAGDQTYIYYGFLDAFYLTPQGELDRIVLEEAMRRPLVADGEPVSISSGNILLDQTKPTGPFESDELCLNLEDLDESEVQQDIESSHDHRFYQIKGDRLMLKYQDISSLNIEFISFRQ
ncbi:hypothetical protein [Polycladidibacter stylochi]|uniref:hypothetical protein n=1 Tax=Polycladidibacter stylochi TaxID=1807766 RepID=UPI00082F0D94|nr:hypothetical protein [Pseudovibrio stylochi]